MSNVSSEWNCVVSRLIKAELQKRGIKTPELVKMLGAIGIEQTEANLRSKLSKGNFSATLFLQIILVISADVHPAEIQVVLEGCKKKQP